MEPTPTELDSYLKLAIELANTAGSIIINGFNNSQTTWKADNTPVTEIDTRINKFVIEEISKQFPTHHIIGEEENHSNEVESDYSWICDPVDGTRAFSIGMHASVFSLALTYKGNPIVAVILDPFTNRLFTAIIGNGAYLNGEKLEVSKKDTVRDSSLGIPYKKSFKFNIRKAINDLWDQDTVIFNTFSVLYLGTFVAEGKLEAVVLPSDKAYDCVTLKLILEEAGGKVTDLFGNEQRYDQPVQGMIASNGLIHSELVDIFIKGTESIR